MALVRVTRRVSLLCAMALLDAHYYILYIGLIDTLHEFFYLLPRNFISHKLSRLMYMSYMYDISPCTSLFVALVSGGGICAHLAIHQT